MAIYHFRYKCGKKALGHLLYINGEGKFKDKEDTIEAIKTNNLPDEFKNIKDFWESAIKYERKNANIYREFEISLVKEFSKEKNKEILDNFLKKTFGDKYIYNYAIHNPGKEQPHAHIMFCDRKLDGINRSKEMFFKRYNPKNPEKGGTKKDEIVKKKDYIFKIRKSWENHLNLYLEIEGLDKISADTLKKQRDEAIKNEDLLKAEFLNREPYHQNRYFKYKKFSKDEKILEMEEKFHKIKYKKNKKVNDFYEKKFKKDKFKENVKNNKNKYSGLDFEELLKKKEEIEIQIFKLTKKMQDKNLESEALNNLTNGESNKLKNEKRHLFKMIKTDKKNKEEYKKRINEINLRQEEILKENELNLIDEKLKLKAKYIKPFNYKVIEKEIIDKIFKEKLKEIDLNNNDRINLYKAYIQRTDMREYELKEKEKFSKNKSKIKEEFSNNNFDQVQKLKKQNKKIMNNLGSIRRVNKNYLQGIKLKEEILKHNTFELDEYEKILKNEDYEMER